MKNIFIDRKEELSNPFLQGLIAAGVVPHDQSNILYKYVSFKTAKLILSQCSLKFSAPSVFDDPLELCMERIRFSDSKEYMEEKLRMAYKKKYPAGPEFSEQFTLEEMKKGYAHALRIQRDTSLIFCTCISKINKSMWRKYADKSRCVCLGFYIPTIFKKLNTTVLHVNYVDELPVLDFFNEDAQIRAFEMLKWYSTKLRKWDFEEEVRCFTPDLFEEKDFPKENAVLIPFEPVMLREIIFGAKVSPRQIKEIKNLVVKKGYVNVVYEKSAIK
jgi:hypothetical protein